MYKYNDERLNNLLKDAESYKFNKNNGTKPRDPKDLMVRALLIDASFFRDLKKTPNQSVMFDKKEIKLELGKYVTSNGKTINEDTFKRVYIKSSVLIKDFLNKRNGMLNLLDRIDKVHGVKDVPSRNQKVKKGM